MIAQDLTVQEKKELETNQEKTVPGRYYVPYTDIYETPTALVVIMEMPGVEKKSIDVKLEKNELTVEGQVDFDKYAGFKPVYTEYNVGHFSRSFRLSSMVNKDRIEAKIEDGVLTLTLPKAEEATARKIKVT